MKNIKKSLALLLAFVMILGMCTIGAGAAFNDAAKINKTYKTAVEVMAGMGILAGSDDDGDGKFDFNPAGNVTRAQAAKMIAYMVLGKDAAERLPAKAMFDDVKATDWSAKYVYYLATKGIINGYGDGKFGPNDSVTATQLAKMLLCACGYGKADEFVGAGWDVNVFALANDLSIYKDTETSDYDIAATREEAALYVFNTMTKVNLVNYSADDLIYNEKLVNNAVVKFAGSKYNCDNVEGVITAIKGSGSDYTVLTYTVSNVKKVLPLNIDVATTLLGHKVAVYYNTKEETADNRKSYYNAYYVEDLSTEFFSFMSKYKDIYNALGGANMELCPYNASSDTSTRNVNKDFTYWKNGDDVTYTTYFASEFDWATFTTKLVDKGYYGAYFTTTYSKAFLEAESKKFPLTSSSLMGYFIIDDDGNTIGYKETSTTMDKVVEVGTKAGTEYIKLASKPLDATTNTLENNATTDVVNAYEGIAKGDVVIISKVGSMYTLVKANVVKDVYVSSLTADLFGGLTTINGTYSKSYSTSLSTTVETKNTYNLYLDAMGSYGYAEPVEEATKDLAYIAYAYFENKGVTKYYHAVYVTQDGTVVDSYITPADFTALTKNTTALVLEPVAPLAGKRISTVRLKNDTTTYPTKVEVAEFPLAGVEQTPTLLTSSYRIADKVGTKNYYLNSETLYVYVTANTTTGKVSVTTSNSKPALDDSCDVFFYPVPINSSTVNYNVNTVFIVNGKPSSTAGTSFIYSSGYDANTFKYSSIGSTQLNSDGNLDYFLRAYVEAEYKTDFKLNSDLAGQKDYNTNNALPLVSGSYLSGGFYTYTVDGDGYYSLSKYDGTGDTNRVVDNLKIASLYNGKLSTVGANATVGVDALNVADAAIVDFSKYGITTIDEIQSYVEDGYSVYVSFWSYNYDTYLNQYGAGNSSAKTSTIYISKIDAPAT